MPVYKVLVQRMQTWVFTIKAEGKDEAKTIADDMALSEPANDDYSYDTSIQRELTDDVQADNA